MREGAPDPLIPESDQLIAEQSPSPESSSPLPEQSQPAAQPEKPRAASPFPQFNLEKKSSVNEGTPEEQEKVKGYRIMLRALGDFNTRGSKALEWNERKKKFVNLLKEGDIITQDMLNQCRMYHVMSGSTLTDGTVDIHSFDLPGGVIQKFIEHEYQRAQAQQG